jgi:hypothetical protein
VRSQLRAARNWIIGALLAGLAASIAAVMVVLTQTGLSPLMPSSQGPGPGASQTVNTASGPILAVTTNEAFSTCMGDGGIGWVFPAGSTSVISAAPGNGIKHGGKTWDQDPPAFGAVRADFILLSITASDSSPSTIVLHGIKFRVIHRQPALRGTLVDIVPRTMCGPVPIQYADVNLDTSPPTLTPAPTPSLNTSGLRAERTAPLMFPYTISQSDPAIFALIVSTHHCNCTWTAELDWTVGSEVGHTVIKDNGQPFHITAADNLPTVTW